MLAIANISDSCEMTAVLGCNLFESPFIGANCINLLWREHRVFPLAPSSNLFRGFSRPMVFASPYKFWLASHPMAFSPRVDFGAKLSDLTAFFKTFQVSCAILRCEVSAFVDRISIVCRSISKKEVIGIAAKRIITFVADELSRFEALPMNENPQFPIDDGGLSMKAEDGTIQDRYFVRPIPASGFRVDASSACDILKQIIGYAHRIIIHNKSVKLTARRQAEVEMWLGADL